MPNILPGSIPKDLITPSILEPNDPRIRQTLNSHYLQDLKQALKAGTYRERFPVGSRIPDLWKDRENYKVYLVPQIVVDYRTVQTAERGDRLGAILLQQNVSFREIVFDYRYENDFMKSRLKWDCNSVESFRWHQTGPSANLLDATTDVLVDGVPMRFFPPSLEELHFDIKLYEYPNLRERLDIYDNPELDQLAWEYFRDTPIDIYARCLKRVFRTPEGRAQSCWLRNAHWLLCNDVWVVDSAGSADHKYVGSKHACVIASVVTAD